MEDYKTVMGRRIAAIRAFLGANANDFGKAVGRSDTAVYAIEAGRSGIRADLIGQLKKMGFSHEFIYGSNVAMLDEPESDVRKHFEEMLGEATIPRGGAE